MEADESQLDFFSFLIFQTFFQFFFVFFYFVNVFFFDLFDFLNYYESINFVGMFFSILWKIFIFFLLLCCSVESCLTKNLKQQKN